jgi:hypothetical protein
MADDKKGKNDEEEELFVLNKKPSQFVRNPNEPTQM